MSGTNRKTTHIGRFPGLDEATHIMVASLCGPRPETKEFKTMVERAKRDKSFEFTRKPKLLALRLVENHLQHLKEISGEEENQAA